MGQESHFVSVNIFKFLGKKHCIPFREFQVNNILCVSRNCKFIKKILKLCYNNAITIYYKSFHKVRSSINQMPNLTFKPHYKLNALQFQEQNQNLSV